MSLNDDVLGEIFSHVMTRFDHRSAFSVLLVSKQWNAAFKKFVRYKLFNGSLSFYIFSKERNWTLSIHLYNINRLVLDKNTSQIILRLLYKEYWINQRLRNMAKFLNWSFRLIEDKKTFQLAMILQK
jgi:hypothetical protein